MVASQRVRKGAASLLLIHLEDHVMSGSTSLDLANRFHSQTREASGDQAGKFLLNSSSIPTLGVILHLMDTPISSTLLQLAMSVVLLVTDTQHFLPTEMASSILQLRLGTEEMHSGIHHSCMSGCDPFLSFSHNCQSHLLVTDVSHSNIDFLLLANLNPRQSKSCD